MLELAIVLVEDDNKYEFVTTPLCYVIPTNV